MPTIKLLLERNFHMKVYGRRIDSSSKQTVTRRRNKSPNRVPGQHHGYPQAKQEKSSALNSLNLLAVDINNNVYLVRKLLMKVSCWQYWTRITWLKFGKSFFDFTPAEIMIPKGHRLWYGDSNTHQRRKSKNHNKSSDDHELLGVAFHYANCKIKVLTLVKETNSYFILWYPEADGKLGTLRFFNSRLNDDKLLLELTSHPNGPLVVASITYPWRNLEWTNIFCKSLHEKQLK